MSNILDEHGAELIRYISPKRNGLISCMEDGSVFLKTPWEDWKCISENRIDFDLSAFRENVARMKQRYETHKPWKLQSDIPDNNTLSHWCLDGVCETVDGQSIEPDGTASNGSPSWLIALGLI